MDFFDLIGRRRSERKFSAGEVTEEELGKVLFAARRAPVGSNLYRDIHLTVVRNGGILRSLSEASARRFQDRAEMRKIMGDMEFSPEPAPSPSFDPFYGASLAVFVSHRKQDVQPGIEFSNAACVVYSMHLAALDLGLGSVFIWGALESMRQIPELDNTRLLELPAGFEPLLGIAVGRVPREERPPRKDDPGKIGVNYIR